MALISYVLYGGALISGLGVGSALMWGWKKLQIKRLRKKGYYKCFIINGAKSLEEKYLQPSNNTFTLNIGTTPLTWEIDPKSDIGIVAHDNIPYAILAHDEFQAKDLNSVLNQIDNDDMRQKIEKLLADKKIVVGRPLPLLGNRPVSSSANDVGKLVSAMNFLQTAMKKLTDPSVLLLIAAMAMMAASLYFSITASQNTAILASPHAIAILKGTSPTS